MWITNGCHDDKTLGDVFLTYARTGPERQDISLFIVENGFPGFKLGQKITDKCGMRASTTAELVFENCEVPRENVVGDIDQGSIPMMRNLEIERLALAAMSCGIARRCVHDMVQYANDRTAFNKPLRSFGQIQRHIAESFAEYQACRAYAYNVAGSVDLHGVKGLSRVDSDGVKLVCTTMATTVANRAMQVMGGYGYVGEYVVERLWRDAKLLEIGGGTLEAHQKNISHDLGRYGLDRLLVE